MIVAWNYLPLNHVKLQRRFPESLGEVRESGQRSEIATEAHIACVIIHAVRD